MDKALNIVKSLEKLPEAVNFLKPVDFKTLGLVDYPFIIKTPMDLSTVRKKIKADKYSTIDEVLEDLILIWDNCRAYNQAGSAIVASANSMQNKLKAICEESGILMTFPEKRERNTVNFDMKVQLAEKFRLSSPETLAEVIRVIESNAKGLMEKHGGKFLQIKLDGIDKALFDKVWDLLEEQPKLKKVKVIER